MSKFMPAVLLSLVAVGWFSVQAADEKPAASSKGATKKAELADNAKNQADAEPIVKAIEALGFKPDPADTNRLGGAMTFTVNRDVLVSVGKKLNGKTISVGFDGKVTIQ